ncbi:MAG: glycosyltransferase family 4 protein [Saprospirales bacterium]|jgi:glycosyltransferase involved in cell wall biosynthesis|nr:glycosyltransferase family 4 protein [Saprospirales bacterium]
MNILLLTTYAHGGAGVACRRLQKALQQNGEHAAILTREQMPSRWPFYLERLSFLPFERDKAVRFAFSLANFGQDIAHHPAVRKADILHLHWINQGFLSLTALKNLAALGKPVVWTLHDMWAFTGGCHYSGNCQRYRQVCGNCPYLRRPAPKDLSNRIWQRKKAVFPKNLQLVTCSKWLGATARESSLFRHYDILSIPNPIDTASFSPMEAVKRQDFRRETGIPPNTFVLLFVSMKVQEERKGFRYLREALHVLKKNMPELPVTLLVLGAVNPADLDALPYPCHSLGLVKDDALLAKAYSSADVFVIPSLEDNLPNTVMESLSCGTPVAGFNTGGIPEMVDHLQNGYIAEQRDSQGLANGLQWILAGGPENLDRLRAAARNKVEKHYAEAVVANQYINLYQRLLSGP